MATQPGGYNTYIGARYVPIFDGEWDNTKQYEPLTIVQYQGDTYTSKTYVPVGIDIKNEVYWILSGNYNAQIEEYRKQVEEVKTEIGALQDIVDGNTDDIMHVKNASFLQSSTSFVFYGDSITWGQVREGQASPTFPETFGNIVNATNVVNRGVGGSCLSNWSQISENYRVNSFTNRMLREPLAEFDTIFVMYGTNDYGWGVPLGQEFDSNTETFYGAVNESIKYLCSTYPTKEIYFITPPYGNTYRTPNPQGLTILSYINAINDRCNYYSIPVIPLNELMGTNQFNHTSMFWDSLHPNQQTYNKIGKIVAKSYYYNAANGKEQNKYLSPAISVSNMVGYNDFVDIGLRPFENASLQFGPVIENSPSNQFNDSKSKFDFTKDMWYTISFSVKNTGASNNLHWSFYELPIPNSLTFEPTVGEHHYVFSFQSKSTGTSVLQFGNASTNTSSLYVTDIALNYGMQPLTHSSSLTNYKKYVATNISANFTTGTGVNQLACVVDPQGRVAFITGTLQLVTPLTDNYICADFPPEFKPSVSQYFRMLVQFNNVLGEAYAYINQMGQLGFIGPLPDGTGEIFIAGSNWVFS